MSEQTPAETSPTVQQAIVSRKKWISPIWIIPIIAALIGAWLLYKGLVDAPISVVITFESAEGMTEGKTMVMYKGLHAGMVKEFRIGTDFKNVDVVVEFDKRAKPILVSDTRFWLVKPRITLRGVAGLSTVLAGDYIAMRPGKKGSPHTTRFTAITEPPPIAEDVPGLHLKLNAKNLDTFEPGSPVYYKKIEVGEVVNSKLLVGKGLTQTKIFIKPKYEDLVTKHSRFYNASGIEIEGSLTGFTLRTQSLTTILMGGIAFDTPQHSDSSTQAVDNETYTLYDSYEDAQQERGASITITFTSAEGVDSGTNIIYNGLRVGEVDSVSFGKTLNTVVVKAHLLQHANDFAQKGTRFWVVKPEVSLSEVAHLGTLITGDYIAVKPPRKKGKPADTFTGLNSPPVYTARKKGLEITLTSDRRGSIKIGNEVFYREIAVGQVIGFNLDKTADKVLIQVNIEDKYKQLVRKNSVFWNASGISVHAGLFSGVQIDTESLKAILEGGVAFATPDNQDMGSPASKGDVFPLQHELNEDWLEWKPTINLTP